MLNREQIDSMSIGDLAIYNNDPVWLVQRFALSEPFEISGDYIARRKRDKLVNNA